MNAYVQQDWQRAIAADPRIAELADAACALLRKSRPDWFAANMYGDVRQYLERLVGYDRGQPMPDGSRTQIPGAHETFLRVATRPVEVDAVEAAFLGDARAYDVTHDVFFTRLSEIDDEGGAQ